MLALLAIGLPSIYSASHLTVGASKAAKQAVFAGVGLVGMLGVSLFDYRGWRRYGRLLYLGIAVLLLVTLFVADEINGARSWINLRFFNLQPSEFAKVALIIAHGALLARLGPRITQLPPFLRSLAFFVLPMLLVLAQPDFGTAMVLGSIWFVMVLLAGARWWMLLAVVLAGALTFGIAWRVNIIKPYQKARLNFINADPSGSGFHQRQARIAIGSGQFFGKGFLHGTQARHGFLPEQDTDFIFAVIAEQFGFLGSIVVLALYLFILVRLLRLAEEADTPFGRFIAGGVAAMIAVHVIINIGMCLTLMPVTGVPLPLLSYGGSNLLTNLLALGVVLNISRYREPRRAWAGADTPLVRLPD